MSPHLGGNDYWSLGEFAAVMFDYERSESGELIRGL